MIEYMDMFHVLAADSVSLGVHARGLRVTGREQQGKKDARSARAGGYICSTCVRKGCMRAARRARNHTIHLASRRVVARALAVRDQPARCRRRNGA